MQDRFIDLFSCPKLNFLLDQLPVHSTFITYIKCYNCHQLSCSDYEKGCFLLNCQYGKMTEDPNPKDDDCLVRVKAQVMTRDDAGWIPMGGGGMSIVGLRKLVLCVTEDIKNEYLIHGQRLSDQSVVLNCILRKEVALQYNVANPTFHHWKMEDKRFGLTFQSSADARAFQKAIRRAMDDLSEGTADSQSHDLEVGEDDVFMALELPLSRKDSSSLSASTMSTTTSSPTAQSPVLPSLTDLNVVPQVPPHCPIAQTSHNHHFQKMHYISRYDHNRPLICDRHHRNLNISPAPPNEFITQRTSDDVWIKANKNSHGRYLHKSGIGTPIDDDIVLASDYSYVEFARSRPNVHEYSYPSLDAISGSKSISPMKDSIQSSKKHNSDSFSSHPPLPVKNKKKKEFKRDKKFSKKLLPPRSNCIYCREMFSPDNNPRGCCEEAPDSFKKGIEYVSCICCARGVLYHFMSDADGDYGHPCICDASDHTNCKKWTVLALLSIVVPCLICYLPLTSCQKCAVSCGCCGGRHKAV